MACYSKLISPPSPCLSHTSSLHLPLTYTCVWCVCVYMHIQFRSKYIFKNPDFQKRKGIRFKKKSRILNSNSQTLKNLIYTQNTDKNILGKTSPESFSPFLKI